jgi:hypothetical protein
MESDNSGHSLEEIRKKLDKQKAELKSSMRQKNAKNKQSSRRKKDELLTQESNLRREQIPVPPKTTTNKQKSQIINKHVEG